MPRIPTFAGFRFFQSHFLENSCQMSVVEDYIAEVCVWQAGSFTPLSVHSQTQ